MTSEDNIGFSTAEISIIVHATENQDKILQSINNVLYISPDRFSSTSSPASPEVEASEDEDDDDDDVVVVISIAYAS